MALPISNGISAMAKLPGSGVAVSTSKVALQATVPESLPCPVTVHRVSNGVLRMAGSSVSAGSVSTYWMATFSIAHQ
jgi:hypothetical protein